VSNAVLLAISTATLGFQGLSEPLLSLDFKIGPRVVVFALGIVPWIAILMQLRLRRILPSLLVVYVAIVLFWPWPPYRFLVPVLPLLVPYTLRFLSSLSKRLFPWRGRTAVTMILLGVAVGANVALLYRRHDLSQRTGHPYHELSDTRVSWCSYEDLFDWLQTHAGTDDVVASPLDSMIYLYTGLQGFRPFLRQPASLYYGKGGDPVGTVEEVAECLRAKRPRFLVQFPFPGTDSEKHVAELLAELRAKHRGWLEPAYQGEDERFIIFELRSEMEPSVRLAGSSQLSVQSGPWRPE